MVSLEKIEKWAGKGKAKKLIKVLNSKDTSMAAAAINALGKVGGEDAVNAITAIVNNVNADKTLRCAAMKSLGCCGTTASETLLKYFLNKETDSEILAAVKEGLKNFANK